MPRQTVRQTAARRAAFLLTFALACALAALLAPGLLSPAARAAATFVVTNTNNSGAGSLRQAINDANSNPGADTITFQIGSGPQTIKLTERLPALTDAVVIDGATQPGYSGAPIIELDGSLAFDGSGLALLGGDSTVRGLVINSFRGTGIFINLKGGNRVEGCYIGTDATGTLARPNGDDGISIPNSNNVIGGTTPATRNVISGNNGWGVNVRRFCCTNDETPMTGNVIQGNYVGVSAAGDAAIPNLSGGVRLTSVNSGVPVTNNLVGGTTTGAGNVISGNRGDGVILEGSQVANNSVQGNFIGTDATGSFALPNDSNGVDVTGQNNLIGGTTTGARNVISGNGGGTSGLGGGNGVTLGTLSGNVVRGNVIGANASLTAPLPNLLSGVVFGGSNNIVGGTGAGEANIIAFNGSDGILDGSVFASTGNVLRGNSIFSNGSNFPPSNASIGIDLGPLGVTPNDTGDADTGPNNLQNFPVVTSVTSGAGSFNVKGTLNSIASTTYTLDFYANGACDPSGFGEGARHVGSAQVTTNSGGDAPFDLTFNVALPANQILTATATDPLGNTSEFSQCAPAAATVGSVNFDAPAVMVTESAGVASFLLTRTGGSSGPLTIGYVVRGVTARAGSDFTATQGTLNFADGETSKSFTVPVLDDALDEVFFETARITLSTTGDLDTLGSFSTATLNINDDDPAPSVSIGDVSIAEGDTDTTAFNFAVTLSAVSGRDVTVNFNTENGTATGGGNDFFLSAVNSLTIPAGQTSATISILVRGDTEGEPDETFFVNLTSATGANIADGRAQGTILNDDVPPTVSLSINDASANEGNTGTTDAAFTVTLSGASTKTVTIDVFTSGVSATDTVDFQPVSTKLTFAPGELTKAVNVAVKSDNIFEGNETFTVELRNPVNAFVSDDSGLGTIIDDETQPTLSVGNTLVTEGDTGSTTATFTVSLSGPSSRPVVFTFHTTDGTARNGEDYGETLGGFGIGPELISTTISVTVTGDTITEPDETFFLDISDPVNASIIKARGVGIIRDNESASKPPTLQFDARSRSVSEGAGAGAVMVTRSGDSSLPVSVDYATRADNAVFAASDRSDYTPAFGTLNFAAGETSKSFVVLLTDDGFAEPTEFITILLRDPTGGAATGQPAQGRIDLLDNDPSPSPTNPADVTTFFVRQHYHDFLNREPDASGLAFWTGEIEQCGLDALCREVKRINVSAAFFLSIEFQETGFLAYRTYKAAYGDATSPGVEGTVPVIRMSEFLTDTQRIGRDVQVNVGEWRQQLEANKDAYALEFVRRARFLAAFPATMTANEFVSKLDQNAGGVLSADEKAQLISNLGATPADAGKRALALRQVAEHATLKQRELNRAFVLMQYFGYLRRNPDDAPEPGLNFGGWNFWLGKLNEFNGDFVRAEMVKAFLSSDEYRHRFGQP